MHLKCAQEVNSLSDSDFNRLQEFLKSLGEEHLEASLPAAVAESALRKDWLSPEEDAAWANL